MKDGIPNAISATDWMIQNLRNDKGTRAAFDPQLYRHGIFNHSIFYKILVYSLFA